MSVFKFKQFEIRQDRAAMKVGTDGVLLGAWLDVPIESATFLDVGTGTGLIGMMIAQRYEHLAIDGVELDPEAFEQTVENFEESPWPDRLFCYHADFKEFAEEMDETYDFIVSNPPYFNTGNRAPNPSRARARNTLDLSYEELIKGVDKLMSEHGGCAFVIPRSEFENFWNLTEKYGWFLDRVTHVKGTATSGTVRSLVQFSRKKKDAVIGELILEVKRHIYTEEYADLVRDFYLAL